MNKIINYIVNAIAYGLVPIVIAFAIVATALGDGNKGLFDLF